MSIDFDDEILGDFLIEAGEIIEELSGQLISLERAPRDMDLLNGIFRGFHTIKGGAGFLNLGSLVDVCHRAEDVFNILRRGERIVDPGLMDVVLQALDVVKNQFGALSAGREPIAATQELLARLESYTCEGFDAAVLAASEPASMANPAVVAAAPPETSSIGSDSVPGVTDRVAGADWSDAEYAVLQRAASVDGVAENLGAQPAALSAPVASAAPAAPAAVANAVSGDEITDDEFEALLDSLHGKGQGPGVSVALASAPVAMPEAARAAPASDTAMQDLAVAGQKAAAEATVRVDTRRLDQIMNMVGELVLVRNRLANLRASIDNEAVAKAVGNLEHVTTDLQAAVMATRMQPIKKIFGRFPRVVRDLARQLGKEINLELRGEDTDLDKNMVEALADPLVHLVRNAVDHGIEAPEVRVQSGKPATGTVVLSAEQQGDHILLSITDDGAGMNADVLRRKAIEKGVIDPEFATQLSEKEVFNLIFAPGFSTRAEISDVSGRGVGMDVVKTHIGRLNGTIDIESRVGAGTRLSIRLPLTLAILPTLMIGVNERVFALPLSSVNEIFQLEGCVTRVVDGLQCVIVRGKAMPLLFLQDWLDVGKPRAGASGLEQVVVVQVGNRQLGIAVDSVLGREEVVIKPLGLLLQGLAGLAGATITGEGAIALILDVPGLVKSHLKDYPSVDNSFGAIGEVA